MSTSTTYARRYRVLLACLLLGGLNVACGDTGGNGSAFGPSIESFEMQPEELPQNKATGMTDQHFAIQLQVEGFNEPVEAVELFVQNRQSDTNTLIARQPPNTGESQGYFAVGSAECVNNTCGGSDATEACVREQCEGSGNVIVSDDDVLYTLFRDFEPGLYRIAACVAQQSSCSAGTLGTSILQRNLKRIQITE